MNLDLYSSYKKLNSKWIIGLNVRAETIELLEENSKTFSWLGMDNDFLDATPKAGSEKKKIDKLDFIKITNFCASKHTMNKVKRQPPECEKILYIW